MKRLRKLAVLSAIPFLASFAAAQEDDSGLADMERVHETGQQRRKSWNDTRQKLSRKKESDLRELDADLQGQRSDLEKTLESGLQRSGDVEYEAFEPAEPARVVDRPPEEAARTDLWIWDAGADHFDFLPHDIWTLKPEDFRIWKPTRVHIEKPLAAREATHEKEFVTQVDRIVFRDVFLAVPFALTNSTDKDLKIGPRMWIVSENLRFTEELGGFIAKQDVERSMFRELNQTFDLISYVNQNPEGTYEPVQILSAGETRYGVGVFTLPDPELDRMTIIVDGLNNTYRFDRRQKRVLAIEYSFPGDEFYPQERPLELVGKDWRWMWMWYEELEVAPPERFEFQTPSGAREQPKVHWAYQTTLTNHSGESQAIRIRQVDTIVRLKALGIDVEVPLVDDGRSTIHKARVMEEMAQPFAGDRFFAGILEPDQTKVFPVIFDVEEVDWERVYAQVEAGLTGNISIGYGEEPLKPGVESFMPTPELLAKVKPLALTDEQKAKIREDVNSAIGPALDKEKERRMLSADVSAEVGIASGTFRVVRSYFQKGVIESSWIHDWREAE